MYAEDIKEYINRFIAIFGEIENDQQESLNNHGDLIGLNSLTGEDNANVLREPRNLEVQESINQDSLSNEYEIEIQANRNRRVSYIESENSVWHLRQPDMQESDNSIEEDF
mmetsp:Transcript_462/g.416  ORF Transcript_462/g.416 Transcript_462/m.416 type:complete len:111 (+) Transcript_462:169-501(+)